jgi:hypothetical protein
MKRLACLTFEMLLVCMLASCGAPTSMPTPTPISEPVAGMINPGDEIDGMLFTTTDDIDWDISLASLCDFSSWDVSPA